MKKLFFISLSGLILTSCVEPPKEKYYKCTIEIKYTDNTKDTLILDDYFGNLALNENANLKSVFHIYATNVKTFKLLKDSSYIKY